MRPPPNLMPALITPFREDGSCDGAAHRHNLRMLWDAGIRGFLIAGSTGEGPYLEPGERSELLAIARKELGDAAYLMCGVAAESTRRSRAQIEEAALAGADAVLVVTPTSLVRGRHDLVMQYFRDLAATTPLPLFLYSVPAVTGYSLPTDAIAHLASVDGIIGVKDSSGDIERVDALRSGDPDLIIMIGASRVIVSARASGANGAIAASANYAAATVQRVVDGDRNGQRALTAVVSVVEPHGVAGTKAAAELVGLRAGLPRRPLLPLGDDEVREIAVALDELNSGTGRT